MLCFSFLAAILTFQLGDAAIISSLSKGACPTVSTVKDFEASKYLGNWYQHSGTLSFFSKPDTKCVRATYGANDDGSISVRNVAVQEGLFNQVCGYAVIPDPNEPGSLEVHFPSNTGSYKVLDTDYENFSSVYSCDEYVGFKLESAFLLVRDPENVSEEVIIRALNAYTSNQIPTEEFGMISHEGCTYEDPDTPSCS